MEEASATVTPPSRRSKAYLLRDRPPPITPNQLFHELPGDDDHIHFAAAISKSPISPSPRLTINASKLVAAQERLLLLSHSPNRRRKSLVLVQDENIELGANPRRRSKNRSAAVVSSMADLTSSGCGSPRNIRRARRRLEKDITSRDDIAERDAIKVRRQRQMKSSNSHDEKPNLVPLEPHQDAPEKIVGDVSLDRIKEAIGELIMWKNFAKSSLWFGLGTLCFTSTCFSEDVSFSIVSAVSNLGLLLLAAAFIRSSFPRRYSSPWKPFLSPSMYSGFWTDNITCPRCEEAAKCTFRVTEEDITKAIRLILPAINAAIAAVQGIFSGEPSTTLTVAPVLLFTAKYGHCITLWRLLAAGFFIGFTAPKLYSTYSPQIHRSAASLENCLLEGWKACRRRRFLGVSAAMTLWNLLSVKTRIVAAFTCLVVLRYYRQRSDIGGASLPEKQEGNPLEQDGGTAQRFASGEAVVAI